MRTAAVVAAEHSKRRRASKTPRWLRVRKAVSNKSLPVTAPVRVEQLDGVTSFGSLIFTEAGSVTAMQEAKFTVVHKDIDVDMLCGIFQAPDHSEHGGGGWGLPKPSVLISVTGSAQELQLESVSYTHLTLPTILLV